MISGRVTGDLAEVQREARANASQADHVRQFPGAACRPLCSGEPPRDRVDAFFATTRAFWEEWIGYCRYRRPFEEAVQRSALTLKRLTYAPSDAWRTVGS